jgi:hypothetical protein
MKRLKDHIGTALSDSGYIDKDIVGQDLAGVECKKSKWGTWRGLELVSAGNLTPLWVGYWPQANFA